MDRLNQRSGEWTPNSLEQNCLRHLDSDENWVRILGRPRHDESESQSWSPFTRIFAINITQFSFVFSALFILLEYGMMGSFGAVIEDLVVGVIFVALCSIGMAAYVTHLYRRSWNRRALIVLQNEF